MRALLIEQCCAASFAAWPRSLAPWVTCLTPRGLTLRAVRVPSTVVAWLSTSVLAGEPRHPRPHVAYDRLELGVGALPEVHEAAVVLERLGAVAAAFVKLPQPPQARRESTPEVVDVLGRSCVGRHLLVGGQRGIGLPGLLVSQPQFPVAARVAPPAPP